MAEHLLVVTTLPADFDSTTLAKQLISDKLAACANLMPGVQSFYEWEGELQQDGEAILLLETAARKYKPLEQKLVELHPYDLPKIVALPVTAGLKQYLDWADTQCE